MIRLTSILAVTFLFGCANKMLVQRELECGYLLPDNMAYARCAIDLECKYGNLILNKGICNE